MKQNKRLGGNVKLGHKKKKTLWVRLQIGFTKTYLYNFDPLTAPYSSKIDILSSKKGLINWYMVLIQS